MHIIADERAEVQSAAPPWARRYTCPVTARDQYETAYLWVDDATRPCVYLMTAGDYEGDPIYLGRLNEELNLERIPSDHPASEQDVEAHREAILALYDMAYYFGTDSEGFALGIARDHYVDRD